MGGEGQDGVDRWGRAGWGEGGGGGQRETEKLG